MPHSFPHLKKMFQDMLERGLHLPHKGYVVLHENSSVLSELGRFYAVAELEDIETTLDEIKVNGIEVPLNQPPPEILEDIVSQSEHYFKEMINSTKYREEILTEITLIKNELNVAMGDLERVRDERNYLRRRLHTDNPKKDHFYKTVKEMYATPPGTLSCSICFENIKPDELQMTNCGHLFCDGCFTANEKNTDNCAVCRTRCYGVL